MHHALSYLRRSHLVVRWATLWGLLLAQIVTSKWWPGLGVDWLLAVILVFLSGWLLPLRWALPMSLISGALAGATYAEFDHRRSLTANISLSLISSALITWLVQVTSDRVEFLQAVAQSTDEIIYVLDENGRIIYINQVGADVLEYQPTELIGGTFEPILAPWYRPIGWELFRSLLATPTPSRHRIHVISRSGQELVFMIKTKPVRRDGRTYLLGAAQDVTRPEWTEHILSAAFDAYDSPLAVRSPDGRIILCNSTYAQAAGRTKAEIINHFHTPPGLPPGMPHAWSQAVNAGQTVSEEVQNAAGRTLRVNIFPVANERGIIDSHILHVDDMTERKLAQERLVHTTALAATGQIAAGVAHNINNILAAISVSAELLALNPSMLGDQVSRDILCAVERGSAMVRKLYGLAAGGEAPKLERVHAQSLFHGELQLVQPQLVSRGITVHVEAPADLEVLADANLAHQVLMNLIINSIHAMPEGGLLTLSAVAVDGAVELRVSDTGCGISPEHMERIFLPFFTTKSSGHGTGLGLPTSLSMVRAMGGDILVDSTLGSGSTFTIRLKIPERAAAQ